MNSSYIDVDKEQKNYSERNCFNKPASEPFIRDQAAGLIHSTSADMGCYLWYFSIRGEYNGNRIISEASLKDMESNHIGDAFLPKPESWGYGLLLGQSKNQKEATATSPTITAGHGRRHLRIRSVWFRVHSRIRCWCNCTLPTPTTKTIVCSATKLFNLYLNSAGGLQVRV